MGYREQTDAALSVERASYDGQILALETEVDTLNSAYASLEAQVRSLQAEIEDLRSQVGVVRVPLGADLQAALNDAGEGATVQLAQGTYYGKNITPLNGQTIQGPAMIRPQGTVGKNDDGFRMKASGQVVDVTLVDLDIAGYGRHGVGAWIGTHVYGGRIHDNGKDGVGGDLEGYASGVVLDRVELDNNGLDPDWWGNSGGVKMFHTHGFTADRCHVHDNIGNGVWGDAQCGDMDVLDCIIVDNTRKGVFYEKGGAGDGSFLGRDHAVYDGFLTVRGCTIQRNNTDGVDHAHPGVALYSAKNVLIENNVFGGNGNGIIVRDDPKRLVDDKHGWVPENITIRGNVLNGDGVVGCDLPGVTCE